MPHARKGSSSTWEEALKSRRSSNCSVQTGEEGGEETEPGWTLVKCSLSLSIWVKLRF